MLYRAQVVTWYRHMSIAARGYFVWFLGFFGVFYFFFGGFDWTLWTLSCSGWPCGQSALCCPCGLLLIQTQRSCRKELDARTNADVLHHASTESNGGVCQSRHIPASARLCCPSSWLQHWDVSHGWHVTAQMFVCAPPPRNHKAKARNSHHAELILTGGLKQIKQTLW